MMHMSKIQQHDRVQADPPDVDNLGEVACLPVCTDTVDMTALLCQQVVLPTLNIECNMWIALTKLNTHTGQQE